MEKTKGGSCHRATGAPVALQIQRVTSDGEPVALCAGPAPA